MSKSNVMGAMKFTIVARKLKRDLHASYSPPELAQSFSFSHCLPSLLEMTI